MIEAKQGSEVDELGTMFDAHDTNRVPTVA
jgi:hypothetical protein